MSRKLLPLALVGCAAVTPGSSSQGGPANGSENPPVVRESLVVHEWGTFTSMQSSVGRTLEGLHHEEERLPSFVYGRNGGAVAEPPSSDAGGSQSNPKEMEKPASELHGVTQKLETPVLYFYSDTPIHAKASVQFPGGILSEWYPNARSFAPALNQWDRIANGKMDWEFDVTPGLDGFPEVSPEDVWAPSRRVASTPIAVGGEHEKFIFYRGLGAFEGPLRSKANAQNLFEFANESDEAIPAAFLLRVHADGGAIVKLESISAHGALSGIALPILGKERNLDVYVDEAKAQIKKALVESGLYDDESQAMVDTWSRSYFKTPGARILYIVPRAWTDKLLPLRLDPAPGKLVRTLVGRVEILSRDDEASVASIVESYSSKMAPTAAVVDALGRFAEPKLRRACELVSPANAAYCADAVTAAQAMP